jgi:hypothetical protein
METFDLRLQGADLALLLGATSAQDVQFASTISQNTGRAEEENQGGCKGSHDGVYFFQNY